MINRASSITMKTRFAFIVLVIIMFQLNAQDVFNNRANTWQLTDRLKVEDFAYPIFLDGEQHSWFKVTYDMSDSFLVELQGFYDSYRTGDRFRMPILAKQYFGNRTYLFTGVEYEFALGQTSNRIMPDGEELPKLKPRLGYIAGFGHDVNETIMLEAKTNYQINDSKVETFGQDRGKKNVFTLGSKFKF